MSIVSVRALRICLVASGLALPAWAALGGGVDSIALDASRVSGRVQKRQAGAYSVHEIRSPTGTVIREFVSAAGTVFGVAWQGPFAPDFPSLLGTRFPQLTAALQARRAAHVRRKPVSVRQAGLVFEARGRMRAYVGRAYAPELLPGGLGPEVVQ